MSRIHCPHCRKRISAEGIASLLGSLGGTSTSEAKAAAARANGQKGGRPRIQTPARIQKKVRA